MGCFASTLSDGGGNRRRLKSIGELAIFLPGFRIPIAIDFTQPLGDSLPKSLVNRLSALSTRIVSMAMHEAATATKLKQKKITRNGTSTFSDLLQALEDYLPVLLGLTKDGRLKDKVKFAWINQEDDDEQTAIANVWYEVLSVLHLMAMLCLAEANYLLLPRKSNDGYQQQVSEDNRRKSIDILLRAAGYLDCSIHHVLPQMPLELRRNLPVDLSEEELNALCMQALGQGVDIQLEMAIDSPKATLAVKRRLACEMVKYFNQVMCIYFAQEHVVEPPLRLNFADSEFSLLCSTETAVENVKLAVQKQIYPCNPLQMSLTLYLLFSCYSTTNPC